MSGVSTPSFRLSRTMTRTVPPSRRNARSWSSAQICALDRHTSSRTDLREQPERQDEEPRASVLARAAVADHRPLAVVDLAFFAGRGRDDDARLGRRACRAASRRSGGHSRTARESRGRRPGPARSRRRCAHAPAPRRSARDTARRRSRSALGPARRTRRVGGHLRAVMAGFAAESRWTPPRKWPVLPFDSLGRPRPRTAMPGGFQIAADRLAVGRRSPAAMRRSVQPKSPEREDLLLFVVVQDVAHAGEGPCVPSPSSTSRPPSVNGRFCRCRLMAGFGCPPRPGSVPRRQSGVLHHQGDGRAHRFLVSRMKHTHGRFHPTTVRLIKSQPLTNTCGTTSFEKRGTTRDWMSFGNLLWPVSSKRCGTRSRCRRIDDARKASTLKQGGDGKARADI